MGAYVKILSVILEIVNRYTRWLHDSKMIKQGERNILLKQLMELNRTVGLAVDVVKANSVLTDEEVLAQLEKRAEETS